MKKIFLLFTAVLFFATEVFAQPVLKKIGVYKCGRQPKQVMFSPDGNYIVLPLLDDDGFDIFSVNEKKVIKRINPPDSKKVGFAECLFVPEKKAFFVSQMTTAKIYEYTYPGFEYKREISTGGNWSKFIAYSPEKNMLAVSNWVSNDVSLIDYASGKVLRKLSTGKAPRGLYFIDGGNSIISLSFDSGLIEQFSTGTGVREKKLYIADAAMRHIAVNKNCDTAFISDMFHRTVLKIDLKTFTVKDKVKVFNNPNTIALYNDRYLFVSCRGPNNPNDYTKRSPVNGKIMVIDTTNMEIVKTIEGGNQPTGLDISPDGKILCFSDFQDEAIELYSIE